MAQNNENVDLAEIEKFSQLAHQWWDLEGEFKTLHQINPLRLDFVKQYTTLSERNVLDLGCGGGIFSEALAKEGAQVTAIDLAKKSLKIAKLHALEAELNIDYRQISAEDLAQESPEKFDIVTCMEMLEHVPDPQSIVSSCAQLLKPNGLVFFATINRNPKAYGLMVLAAEYLTGMVKKGTHDYKKFIKPSELARMGRLANLSMIGQTGLFYNPLTQQFSLSKDTDVNYWLVMQKTK